MPEVDENSKWIRKLSPIEEILSDSHDKGFMIIRYAIRLCSHNPLEEDKVRTSLFYLQRKVPTLRLCVARKEDGELWFKERDNDEIDFLVGNPTEYQDVHDKILYNQFNATVGPLWRARLFPCHQEEPFHLKHLQEKFPHQYNLLFGFHHSITDGTSNLKICDLFLNILNDVLSGNTINEEEQLGYHISYSEIEKDLEIAMAELKKNEDELQSLFTLVEDIEAIPLQILKAYPSLTPKVQRINSIPYDMSIEDTDKLLKKCKAEKVTINSAVCTAIHAALVEIMQKAGIANQEYLISHQQVVNLRRYWKDASKNPLGTAITLISMVSKVPSENFVGKFWDLAREFNEDIKRALQNYGAYKETVAREMSGTFDLKKFTSDDIKDLYNYSYSTSNLGNLSSIFRGEGEQVQATHLSRSTSGRKQVSMHELHTFRGRLLYVLDYGNEYISREGAQLWCDAIFKVLKQVV